MVVLLYYDRNATPTQSTGENAISYLDIARGLLTRQDPKQFLFFTRTPNGRRAGKEFLARLEERTDDRDKAISVRSFRAQLKAIHRWGRQQPADLASIHQPILVMNGESDRMVPTKNTVDLDRRLPNSQLVIYPDAGHGGVFQFHEDFVKRTLEFLKVRAGPNDVARSAQRTDR
jgi:pimeloyl-ACP methyl ester carboxylesterase